MDYPARFLVEVTDPGRLPYANLMPALNMALAQNGAKCTVTDVSNVQGLRDDGHPLWGTKPCPYCVGRTGRVVTTCEDCCGSGVVSK